MRLFCACAMLILLSGCVSKKQSYVATIEPSESTTERVNDLLARIDENPDPLHADYTPAVHDLIEIGEPAILPTLELMLSEQSRTREHAQRVLEGITRELQGFDRGHGWKEENEVVFDKFWSELGDLDFDASQDKRAASVGLWKKWLASRTK